MIDSNGENSGSNRRRERRQKPYEYLPHVEIYNENHSTGERLTGFVRNKSEGGFSAQFESFPYEKGDLLDVRVGYQRAWAQVAWVESLDRGLFIVGFRLHPEEFL